MADSPPFRSLVCGVTGSEPSPKPYQQNHTNSSSWQDTLSVAEAVAKTQVCRAVVAWARILSVSQTIFTCSRISLCVAESIEAKRVKKAAAPNMQDGTSLAHDIVH